MEAHIIILLWGKKAAMGCLYSLKSTSTSTIVSGSFILSVRCIYRHGRSLRSILCIYFIHICACFLEAYRFERNTVLATEFVGAVDHCSLQYCHQWTVHYFDLPERHLVYCCQKRFDSALQSSGCIHANIKNIWKYVSSDFNNSENERIHWSCQKTSGMRVLWDGVWAIPRCVRKLCYSF